MSYLIPDKAYSVLKWIGLIVCPAIATFVGVVGTVWGWRSVDAWVTTINATGVLVGALLGISAATARPTSDGAE
ncbi:MAG: phage holin [Tractidigestivibacter sp.]|uniref:phage holin n=1 Tax=Tractidigestivibacter sp. TaxID=2847320 RepID=UPI002A828ACF|nr:phage holin [Tractidigestivibacter sp.]MCI6273949.1 phage holin [Coriobacteriaceae bacterium]MDY4533706.1 phage holin [Tractidigestivibacter sp.]